MLPPTPKVSNRELVELWVHGRSPYTQDSYRRYAHRFFDHAGNKPLAEVTLMDLQAWQMSLASRSVNSQRLAIGAIKSLLSFAHKLGAISVNVGILVRSPTAKNQLAEKILTQEQVKRLIEGEANPRNRVILRMLYGAGLRVSELCGLKWRDLKVRGDSGQVTVFGKGGKTRAVLLSPKLWESLSPLRGKSGTDEAVFRSRRGGHLCRSQVFKIVKVAAKRAGIEGKMSAPIG